MTLTLEDAETRLLDRSDPASYRSFEVLLERMQLPHSEREARSASPVALRLCQRLYINAKSFDALPFARANLVLAQFANDSVLLRRAHTACGLLSADTADVAGALEHHTQALNLATLAADTVEMSRVWNNIGSAFCIAGNFPLAVSCYKRVIALLQAEPASIFSRYAAYANLAHCCFHIDHLQEGHRFAALAMEEMTPAMAEQDPYHALVLYRNFSRLLISLGKLDDAKTLVAAIVEMAEKVGSPRASIAASTTLAAYEMSTGDTDVGQTRLDQALVLARAVPATLRDTLICVIRAEDKAGFPAHALLRLHELSDHVYRTAIVQMRKHVELSAVLGKSDIVSDQPFEQVKVRLTSRLPAPEVPPEWKTLQRLAVGAAFRIDSTGCHGIRVGALTQALALERGLSPMRALEFRLAAQLHDIGMASIPEAVLTQAATLNEIERKLVQKHVSAGAEIFAGSQHPRMIIASDMVKYHHAHWDGAGYPDAVAGRSIPLAARMCAVADVYDTIVTDRPYRKARSMETALGELRSVAGTQLDPDLVRSFEVVIRRETANEGIDPSLDGGLENFQKLITALTEDRGYI